MRRKLEKKNIWKKITPYLEEGFVVVVFSVCYPAPTQTQPVFLKLELFVLIRNSGIFFLKKTTKFLRPEKV